MHAQSTTKPKDRIDHIRDDVASRKELATVMLCGLREYPFGVGPQYWWGKLSNCHEWLPMVLYGGNIWRTCEKCERIASGLIGPQLPDRE